MPEPKQAPQDSTRSGEVIASEPEPVTDAGPADPAPDLTDLLKKAESEVADLRDAWLRARADADNLRKQTQLDLARAHKYAIERFAEDLLPVRDALEQSLATTNASPEQVRAGVDLTLKQLVAAFEKARLLELNPVGEKFDPHRHQAMAMVEAEAAPNTVVQVFQKGYLLNDRVLRPALVAVAKGNSDEGAPTPSGEETPTPSGDA